MIFLNTSSRSINIKPKLAIITTFFNPKNYINLKRNYVQFVDNLPRKTDLFPIELSFDNNFFIEHDNVIQLKGNKNNILWQKERLLNIRLQSIPKQYTNIAWIDADIIFKNPDWIKETNDKLNNYKIVQLYEHCYRMNQDNEFDKISAGYIKYHSLDSKNTLKNNFGCGHPGYAWAGRRETLEKIGFLDNQIIGGADSLMMSGFLNIETQYIRSFNKEWRIAYEEWKSKAYEEVRGSVSFISGDIVHLYHGNYENRQYLSRAEFLIKRNFDPKKDLRLDSNLLWASEPSITVNLKKYFASRKEDDNIK
jgi:hypothetical protein